MLIYIAGPMRGYAFYNFPAFDAARDHWKASGQDVINPADLDREHGFDACKLSPDTDWGSYDSVPFDVCEAIDRDIEALKQCDAIYLLQGWQGSKGAKAEKALAEWLGLHVFFQEPSDFQAPAENKFERGILDIASELTGGDRNEDYGPPSDDFTRTAEMATAMFRHKLKPGEKLDSWDVGHFMICVKLSRLQHRPKRDSVIDIAGYANCVDDCYRSSNAY